MRTQAHATHDGDLHSTVVETVSRAIDRACGFSEARTEMILATHRLADTEPNAWYEFLATPL